MKRLKTLALMLAVFSATSALTACSSISNAIDANTYVNTLSDKFEEIVKKTLELESIRNLNNDADLSGNLDDYLTMLTALSNLYLELRNITPTQDYSSNDSTIDYYCNEQIAIISQEKSLVQYTSDTLDENAYRSSIYDTLDIHYSNYNNLRDTMKEIKTTFRNS